MKTTTYKLFGFIPVWSVTRPEENAADLEDRVATAVLKQLDAAVRKNREQ